MSTNLDLENTRRDLIAMREKHGAATPIGYRCSNLIEMLQNHATADDERKVKLAKSISQQMAELAKLVSAVAPHAEH